MRTSNHTPSLVSLFGTRLPRALAGAAALSAAWLLTGLPTAARAQSDNFDAYTGTSGLTSAGWILSSLNPALVTTTFPAVGSGKGLRLQAVPFPPQAPAVGMWYRTNEYTNFCVAVDIVSWPGTDKNQAMVLFARMTESTTGTVVKNQNPATAQGLICNYDASQYGENATDRRQGQFQINLVGPGFATHTIGVAEITLVPGRAYRMIFKGVDWHYTGQIYDLSDLTAPLVTLEADDLQMLYPSGACGVLAFSRQGTTGTAEATFDNYYAGVTDPNPATGGVLAHPVAGTPAVNSRVPAERWQSLLNPAAGLSFTANTYTTNLINGSATRLRLNGVDVSAKLTLSADGTNLSGSLPGSALDNNRLYEAELVVTDLSGTKSSTNLFWFDTFSDAYLRSAGVKVIEAEEYNYNGGVFQLDPIPVSGIDTNTGATVSDYEVGYYSLTGVAGIDFSNHYTFPDFNYAQFRPSDPVRTLSGGLMGIQDANHPDPNELAPASDAIRSQHLAAHLLEYVVCRTEPGEWLNYTRKFSPGFYVAYLRFASFGNTTNELHQVTSDPTQPEQTTLKLGSFNLPNTMRHANYAYTPLVDDAGRPVLLNLGQTNTLRLVMGGISGQDNRKTMLNYLLLVPASLSLYSCDTVNGDYTLEGGATLDAAARTITVPRAGNTRFYRLGAYLPVPIQTITVSTSTVQVKF